MVRENPKQCPTCDRKLLKIKTERYDTQNDQNVPMTIGRMCLKCKTFFRNKEYKDYKMVINDVGT